MQSKFLNLTLSDFVSTFLRFISALRPSDKQLSDKQFDVLKTTLLLPPKYRYRLFTYATKKHVASELKMSVSNLNNRIYELLDKGYLRRDEDKVIYVSKPLLDAIDYFQKTGSLNLTITFESTKDSPLSNTNGASSIST